MTAVVFLNETQKFMWNPEMCEIIWPGLRLLSSKDKLVS